MKTKVWAATFTLAVVLLIVVPLAGCGAGKLHGEMYTELVILQP